MKKINELMLRAYVKSLTAKEKFTEYMKSEDGIGPLVMTILILAIGVILLGFFWEKLSEWLSDIMEIIFGFEPSSSDLG